MKTLKIAICHESGVVLAFECVSPAGGLSAGETEEGILLSVPSVRDSSRASASVLLQAPMTN